MSSHEPRESTKRIEKKVAKETAQIISLAFSITRPKKVLGDIYFWCYSHLAFLPLPPKACMSVRNIHLLNKHAETARNNYRVLEIVWKMAALRDLFCFAENKKHPALVSMSHPWTFNLAHLRWHAMHLGTRVCLLSPTNWELCDRHKKGIYKVEPRMWQRRDRAGDGLTHEFVLNEGGGCFSRHPWRDEEVISLKGMLLELLGKTCMTA